MSKTVAFGIDGKVHLWCETWRLNSKKEVYHFVINGHWQYRPEVDTHLKMEKLWEGEVPPEHCRGGRGYNNAIAWINSELAKEPRLL